MELISIVIGACVTVFSLGLLIVAIASYRKHKTLKLLFVAFVFLVFFIHGILLSLVLFSQNLNFLISGNLSGIFDLIILILLFIAMLKR